MSRESVMLEGAAARCGFEGVARVRSNVTFRGGASASIGSSEQDMLRRDVLLAVDKIRCHLLRSACVSGLLHDTSRFSETPLPT
jgi:hypothetical protein